VAGVREVLLDVLGEIGIVVDGRSSALNERLTCQSVNPVMWLSRA
jgi:hypothetical protein